MAIEEIDTVVIGAGQAGLATSHELSRVGVEHVVLERDPEVGGSWQHRWDSFCLVTPNDSIRLPGGEYQGDDPHGFLPKQGVTQHLRDYARSFAAPVRTSVGVTSLRPRQDGLIDLQTADGGTIRSRAVVAATGAFQEPRQPAWVSELPEPITVLDASGYRRPELLPDGDVLVVGSGQTGCQLAEEVATAGRRVVLACGRAPWTPRRLGGTDIVDWLVAIGFFDQRFADLPDEAAREWSNPQASGARGGHDLHTRVLQGLGVGLAGHLAGFHDGSAAVFADDLADSVAWGDARYADIRAGISRWSAARGLPAPDMPVPAPFTADDAVRELPLGQVGSIVLATGFRPVYSTWVQAPDAFDSHGFPRHSDGASTVVPGLWFVGVHFLRTRKSALLMGVGEDAAIVAQDVAEALAAA